MRKSFLGGTRLILGVIAPLALALAILAGPIIEAWVGSGFEGGASVTVFLCAAVVIWVLIDTGVTMLLGAGTVRGPAAAGITESTVNIGLSVLLAHLIGLEGVALATLLAAAAVNLLGLLPFVCRRFEIRLWDFGRPLLAAHVPPAAASLLVGWLITRADPTGAIAVIGAAVAIVATYLAVFAVSGLDGPERSWLLARLRRTTSPQVPAA
jgi:O-antigen/teichoic acid export membrane protein